MFNFTKRSTYFIRSFIKIESLAKYLFCSGDNETLDYCMEVYRQFIDKEKLDFFMEDSQGLKLALNKLTDELSNFEFYLENVLTNLYFFLLKKYRKHLFISEKYQENLNKIKQVFLMDLQNQFKKLIRKNSKYSSGIYVKKGFFLERMKYTYIFDGENFFKIEKNFIII